MQPSFQNRFAPALYILIFFAGFLTASIWFNPKDHLADLAPTVTAIAAAAFVWLVWAAVSVRMRVRGEMVRREKTIQQESVHPVLHASVQHLEDKPETLVLVIRNSGKGMAKNVRFEPVQPSEHPAAALMAERLNRLPALTNGLDMLAPNENSGSIFADLPSLEAALGDGGFGGIVKIIIRYENVLGNPCVSETDLDISLLNLMHEKTAKRFKLPYSGIPV